MSLINLSNIVSEYTIELKRLKASMSEKFQEELKSAFKEVFEQYPNIIKITWMQFTPYFNDGSPCIFSVHDLSIFDETIIQEDDDDYEEGISLYGEDAEKYPLLVKMETALMSADDLLLEMFGDHCKITVTPNGIDVAEYDHD